MSLLPGHRTNFDTLRQAALNNDLALMDCRHRDTGEPIAVLCATNRCPRGEIALESLKAFCCRALRYGVRRAGVFFLDLPNRDERRAIWNLYLAAFDLDRDQKLPTDESWTGAEIRSCCRLAALLDLPLTEAARNIVPVGLIADLH